MKLRQVINITKTLRDKRKGAIKWKQVELSQDRKKVCIIIEEEEEENIFVWELNEIANIMEELGCGSHC